MGNPTETFYKADDIYTKTMRDMGMEDNANDAQRVVIAGGVKVRKIQKEIAGIDGPGWDRTRSAISGLQMALRLVASQIEEDFDRVLEKRDSY